jgi:UPF0716 family protein affecting phage T7 exclusion
MELLPVMLGVLRLLLLVRVVGTAMLGDLLLLLVVLVLRVVGTTMKAAAGIQTLDEMVRDRIRNTETTRTRMHHHVLVQFLV